MKALADNASVRVLLPGHGPLVSDPSSTLAYYIDHRAERLAEVHGGASPAVTGQFRPGDVRHVVADPARAADLLDFRAAVSLDDGLAEFAEAPLRDAVPTARPRV